jgi:hypothetical protein
MTVHVYSVGIYYIGMGLVLYNHNITAFKLICYVVSIKAGLEIDLYPIRENE